MVPVFVMALVLASTRQPHLPVTGASLEALGYGVAALTIGAGLRAWKGLLSPAYPTVVGLLVVALATYSLPHGWTMVDPQPWGPPYAAALIRWTALVLTATGLLALALRDPMTRRRNPR